MYKFETFFKTFFKKTKYNTTYVVGDLKLNLLDHSTNAKVQHNLDIAFQNFVPSLISQRE